MKPATLLIAALCLAVLVGAYAAIRSYWTTPVSPPISEQTALARLRADLQNAAPHFVASDSGAERALSAQDNEIQEDLVSLYIAQYAESDPNTPPDILSVEARNGVRLDAIGTRYLLVTEADAKGATDEVLDSQTGRTAPIFAYLRYYLSPERNVALYIDSQALYTYSPDQPSAVLVPGSQLSGSETYDNGVVDGPYRTISVEETHTIESIVISVFDSSQKLPGPDGGTRYEAVGQKTLAI